MRETDIFLALLGLMFVVYGAFGVINQRLSVGFRGMRNLYLFEKNAQIVGSIYFVDGLVMFIATFLSWLNFAWLTRTLLINVWCIAVAVTLFVHIAATMVALRLEVTSKQPKTGTEDSFVEQFIILGLIGLAFIAAMVAGGIMFLVFGVYEAIEGQFASQIIVLVIIGIGIAAIVTGVWRILFYDPPLEDTKQQRNAKHNPEHKA